MGNDFYAPMTDNLINRKYDEDSPQDLGLDQVTIAAGHGLSEGKNGEANPMQPKNDLSSCSCVHTTNSAEETHRLGKSFGQSLTQNAIIAFYGDLGAGKTTFIRGLVEGIGLMDPRVVSSPTFNFLNIYKGNITIYHFDLYKLPRKEEFFTAGFDEYFGAGGVCCIEWAEKLESELPPNSFLISFSYFGAEGRRIEISGGGK